jgi:hypothetical protein
MIRVSPEAKRSLPALAGREYLQRLRGRFFAFQVIRGIIRVRHATNFDPRTFLLPTFRSLHSRSRDLDPVLFPQLCLPSNTGLA